ncbi:MAG TPA: 2-succinyl-6-hydroxy-2,4-cyclohexadiene-1-carboxylate synthase [Candidatus Limnocylindrales bacterium]|nr:2-succinyl-6-hydroxy-2,4-cyclohexadiene-1-carboxylate synthase [Candidatus Limnocylindrales bacterium]
MTGTPAWAIRERGEGPPLVLLHGFTGSGAAWAEHEEALAAGHRLVIPDLPGHGGTAAATPRDASVERAADDLAAILAERVATPAVVLGYSLGARVALRLAVEHPDAVARLVLESPSAGIDDPQARTDRRAADEALARRLERDGMDAFVAEWEQHPIFASHAAMPPERLDRVRAMRLGNTPAGLATSLRGAGQGSMEPLTDRLAGIAVPTLVIAGALDATGCPRAAVVAAGIPRARLVVIDDAGHTPHDEQPDTFRRLVLDFLEEDLPA